jgi:hypothetical protein
MAARAGNFCGRLRGFAAVLAACLLASAPVVGAEPVDARSADAFKALAARVQRPEAIAAVPPPTTHPPAVGAPPLPGDEWTDPDSVNWAEPADPRGGGGRRRGLLGELRGTEPLLRPQPSGVGGGRLLDRLRDEIQSRGERRIARGLPDSPAVSAPPVAVTGWPQPVRLLEQLDQLAARVAGQSDLDLVAEWATGARSLLQAVLDTAGPHDPQAATALIPLADAVPEGMSLAEGVPSQAVASDLRRAALAVSRRAAVWRAVAAADIATTAMPLPAVGPEGDVAPAAGPITRNLEHLLAALELYESATDHEQAEVVHDVVAAFDRGTSPATRGVSAAVREHYLSPNVRVAVHQLLLTRLMPEATVQTGPLQDYVLGRKVRGTKTIEQSMGVRFIPASDAIRLELLVQGVVASRTVTESGPVAFHSRGAANFTVRKPITVSPAGMVLGAAVGTASNDTRLASIETDFDSVPIMGSLVRNIARNQHAESRDEASREVNDRIISRACREVDAQAEPRFNEMAERIRRTIWEPLTSLGLDPTPVAMQTTADMATARLRLAAAGQLAAHTPRPRAPEDALLSVQVHDSTINNAGARLGLAGRTLPLEELIRLVCEKLAVPARIPDDLPDDVAVAFATSRPLRVDCRDGLVRLTVSLDALESGRRAWYDVVASVAYRPVVRGTQVFLEREGPVQIGGPGHQGRMEIALRTIFGKIFAKERPIALLPPRLTADPRLADVRAVQAVSTDGWFAFALASTTQAGGAAPATTAEQPPAASRRTLRR